MQIRMLPGCPPARTRTKKYPKAPTTYRLKRTLDEDDELLPLSLDTRLMSQEPVFPEEVVLDFTNALRSHEHLTALQMVGALILLLSEGEWTESDAIPEIDPSTDILRKLVRAIHNRLLSEGSTLVAYDIGLVHDARVLYDTSFT